MTPVPIPSNDPLDSPLGRYLLDPSGTFKGWLAGIWEAIAPWLAAAATVAAIVVPAALGGWLVLRRRRKSRIAAGARWMSILLPPEVDSAGAETLWFNLVELLRPPWRRMLEGQPHLSFEYLWSAGGLRIGIWVPGSVVPDLVERAVLAAWPGAQIELADPPHPLGDATSSLAGELRLGAAEWFPLKTDHAADPLRALLGAAGGLREGQTAAVQVLARPVTAGRLARCLKAARKLRTGESPNLVGKLLDVIQPGPPAPPINVSDDPARSPDIRMVLEKAAGPGWEVVVRYAVGSTDTGRAARQALRGRAHAIASAFGAFTGRNRLARKHLRRPDSALSARRLGKADLVCVGELAGLAHLPTDANIPDLSRAGARPVAPKASVPSAGKVLGDTDAGPRRPVAVSPADACYHLHVLGATGSGKSTLLTNLVLEDAAAGRGAVVIDPKGDLVVDILDRLPANAADKLVLIDPASEPPPTMNVLSGSDPELVVDHLVGIFRNLFRAHWGPRTDDVLRAACLTLLSDPKGNATLADVPVLLGDRQFRNRLTSAMDDPGSLAGFWDWYDAMSESQQAQVVGPVMNKLRAFLMRGFAVRRTTRRSRSQAKATAPTLTGAPRKASLMATTW